MALATTEKDVCVTFSQDVWRCACAENNIGACVAAQIVDRGGDQVNDILSGCVAVRALKATLALVWRHKLWTVAAIKWTTFSQDVWRCVR